MNRAALLLIIAAFLASGCGAFKSLRSSEVRADSSRTIDRVINFNEVEAYTIDLPAYLLPYLNLPNGFNVDRRPAPGDTSRAEPQNTRPDSAAGTDAGDRITVTYERRTEARDSTRDEREAKTETLTKKETEADTGSGFTWLFVGIAAALAGVVALFIFLRR